MKVPGCLDSIPGSLDMANWFPGDDYWLPGFTFWFPGLGAMVVWWRFLVACTLLHGHPLKVSGCQDALTVLL